MPRDTCADYNAFGRDPKGLIAYLSAWFFGPNWVPLFPAQVFAGPPQPPHYGPPAAYQLRCLPPGFIANPPPQVYGPPTAPYLDPPPYFHPSLFDALKYTSTFCYTAEVSDDSSNEGSDTEWDDDEGDVDLDFERLGLYDDEAERGHGMDDMQEFADQGH